MYSQNLQHFLFMMKYFFSCFCRRKIASEMANLARAFLLFALLLPSTITSSLSRCPRECTCDLDTSGRYVTACLTGNLKQIPINELDKKMEIIIIQNPKNTLTIGHLFSDFKKLEILRITDANVPAIGMHSFWGVPSLKTLDLSRNNISLIYDDNFKGQQNLIELNLAKNKLERVPSGTFKYLTVSDIYCTLVAEFIDIFSPTLVYTLIINQYCRAFGC
jgi:Leucine-rich repeat (LRR) protein